jgi:hypothetical protein
MTILKFIFFEKNDNGNDDFVTEIICPAGRNNSINWIVEFDENKENTSTDEIIKNGFTIPEYYFIIQYGEYISEKSNIIKIYGYIDIKLVDENTKNADFFMNETEYEGISDENGRITIRNAVIGERYIMVGDEE